MLAVAGAGVVNLVRAARRHQRRKHLDDENTVDETDAGASGDDHDGPGFDAGRQIGVWR